MLISRTQKSPELAKREKLGANNESGYRANANCMYEAVKQTFLWRRERKLLYIIKKKKKNLAPCLWTSRHSTNDT
jgi:hypothetical protein